MSLRRPFVVFLVLSSLLFSQLAVAAYACPGAQSMAIAASMPDMPDCDMDVAQRDALCQAHCQQGEQVRDTYQPPLPAVAAAFGPSLVVAHADPSRAGLRPLASDLGRRIEPPASIRHCRLHI